MSTTTSPKIAGSLRNRTALALLALFAVGCASTRGPYSTERDKTRRGAAIGAAVGAAGAIATGKREADEILAGAAVGAVAGGAVGVYMDAQEEKLARIPGTTVERIDEETLLVHFDSDVLFDTDSAVVRADGRTTLQEVAEVLTEYPKTAVVVQGHTDSTGSDEHNQELSERRAGSVQARLVQEGIARERISAMGFGEGSPVASNESEGGRQQNRRVEILLRAKA
jgi:outer membrane protein OmpA-like peptidoglycan-associated protein